jgi:hypothetical protein
MMKKGVAILDLDGCIQLEKNLMEALSQIRAFCSNCVVLDAH